MKDRKPIKRPRVLGPVAVALVKMMQCYGITGYRFYKVTHGQVEFEVFEGGPTRKMHFACTPGSPESAAKQAARKLERLILDDVQREATG